MVDLKPLAALLVLASCSADEPLGRETQALTTIHAVTDQGSWEGRHYFELWGSFTSTSYFARVVCDGVEVPSRREYHGPERGQINVSIPEQARGAACSFHVGSPSEATPVGLAPVVLRDPPIDVVGVVDQGVYGGERYFELYGKLDGANQVAEVSCNGRALPTRISWPGTGRPGNYQINVALKNFPAGDHACDFVVRGGFGTMGQQSPAFRHEAPISAAPMPELLGLYHWGNNTVLAGQSQIGVGAQHVREAGFSTIRLIVTPRVRGELVQGTSKSLPYQFEQTAFRCSDKRFLACALTSPEYTAVMDDPRFRTIVLTAYDAESNGEYGWSAGFVDRTFMADAGHRAAIREEFYQAGYELQKRYAQSGKTIVVTNWEADNSVFCGGVYGWSINKDNVRATCPSSMVRERADAMKVWFELRRDGLRDGVAAARAEGHTGVTVADGIEFSSFTLDIADAPRVLTHIVTAVRPAFASYSSYDTINRLLDGATQDQVSKELRSIKQILAERSPGTQLIVGEAGYNVDTGAKQVPLTVPMARAIHDADIATAILWVGFDSMPACDAATGVCRSIVDGFLDKDGKERWILKNLRAALAGLPARPRLRVDTATATAPVNGQLIVRLWGTFPGADQPSTFSYRARLICDGTVHTAEPMVTYQSAGFVQATVVKPFCFPGFSCPPRPRSCQVAVYRVGTSARNDDFSQSNLSSTLTWTW